MQITDDAVTAPQAARILGLTNGRIRQLARAGKLDAGKFGRDWLISRASVEVYRDRRAAKKEQER